MQKVLKLAAFSIYVSATCLFTAGLANADTPTFSVSDLMQQAVSSGACLKNDSSCIAGYVGGYEYFQDKNTYPDKSTFCQKGNGINGGQVTVTSSADCQMAFDTGFQQAGTIGGCSDNNCDFIGKYVDPLINLLTIIFGIVVVISLILGGIQYSTSAGDPQQAGKAKQRITNTLLAAVVYFFLYGFLQFLIPGGLFKGP